MRRADDDVLSPGPVPVNDGEEHLIPPVALWMLPGRSVAARQSPIGRSRDPTDHSALRTHILRGSIGEIPSLVSEAPPLTPRGIATTERCQNDLDSLRARV